MKADNNTFLKKNKLLPFVEMRKAINSNTCYHAHSHDEFSFGIIDTGSARYHNLNKVNSIHAGHTVTINPGDIHACNPDIGDWSFRMLFIDASWVGAVQAEIFSGKNYDYLPFANLYETKQDFYRDFATLFETLTSEDDNLAVESLLIQYLAKCFLNKSPLKKQTLTPSFPPLNRVRELILDQLSTNHSLEDLSKESSLSRFHLIRSFKQVFGLTPHAFQLDERIKKAKTKLKAGHSIIETSAQLGFADQSHFQRNFKKRLAITPKQYQAFFV